MPEAYDEVNGCMVIDCPRDKGIEINVPIGSKDSNMVARFFMSDKQAQELVNIIQNKINARM